LWRVTFPQEPPSESVNSSEETAARVRHKTPYWRAEVYAYLKQCGSRGATAGEIEAALGIKGSTLRPRLRELEGWTPVGKPPRVPLIRMTETRREHMRVYIVV